jgi:hypothetical protein
MTQRHRRANDPIRDSIVIETHDGVRLRCAVSSVGRDTEPRWMIIDAQGEQFVGPPVTTDRTPDSVSRLIDEWWTEHHAKPAGKEPP